METIKAVCVERAMSARARKPFHLILALASALLAGPAVSASGSAAELPDPLRFFEGRTEMLSTVKLITKKPYRSRTVGRGSIQDDGTLHLVQRVHDEGRPAYDRRWHIRELSPGRFTGTMSEAKGPIAVEQISGRYRFRFKMKGGVSVEQWLTPLGSTAAASKATIRKLGIVVGRSDGTIRKL